MPEFSLLLPKTLFLAALAAIGLFVVGAAAVADDAAWTTQLTQRGKSVSVSLGDNGYTLVVSGEDHVIPAQAAQTQTASVLFDAMFALAQDELGRARVATRSPP